MLGQLHRSLLTAFVGKLFHSSLKFWTKVTNKTLHREGGREGMTDRGGGGEEGRGEGGEE